MQLVRTIRGSGLCPNYSGSTLRPTSKRETIEYGARRRFTQYVRPF